MKEFIPDRPSLEAIRDRLSTEGSKGPISLPPVSKPTAEDLLKQPYPRIFQEPNSDTQYLQLSSTESVQINPEDDGGHDTQLTYPNSLLLQLARLKERKDHLTRIDLADLLRISSQMR